MGLAPIPSRMLHDSVTLKVVNGMDRYQEKTYDDYFIANVHLQNEEDTRKLANDTEVQLKAILFIDTRRSNPPDVDINALQMQSLEKGDTMRALVYDASGNLSGDFAVLSVDGCPDVPATRVHHWELGLI
ncbi:MAG: hypothetical protein J6S14_23035 [Clostridia bacterium]|nr:hypothetical protein [Clostridia bacterium]